MNTRPVVLFLCTGNSCRSQMAEGLARTIHGDVLDARSAGIQAHGLNPRAVEVMQEIGIDITSHTSDILLEETIPEIDLVVTVCDHAHDTCPVLPAAQRVVHQPFEDPPRLAREAEDAGREDEALGHYRRVREEIRTFIEHVLPDLMREDR